MPLVIWRRSAKGNLYQRLPDGATVTVFKRRDGLYGRCLNTDEDGAQFASDSWETEEEAIEAAEEELAER